MKKKTKKILISLAIIIGIIILYLLSQNKSVPSTLSISSSIPKIIKSGFLTAGDDWWRCANQNCPGECRECSSGGSICCEGSGWTLSSSCNICTGENCECLPPSGGDCSENPSKSLDCSRYCTDSGHIYQYNTDECCPPTSPYQKVGTHSCYSTWGPDLGSDNYYTRHSECHKGEESCDGATYKYCKEVSSFIFKYETQGIVKGKCGVECVSNEECGGEIIGNVCQGNDLMEKSLTRLCSSYKCTDSGYSYNLIEHCDYKCENGVCIVKQCNEGELKCDTNLLICQNNQFVLKETCENGCENNACKKGYTWLIILVIFIGVIGGLLYLYKRRKR